MEEVFLGTILPWGGEAAPKNFLFCDGQTLKIAENHALYSLLGNRFGGDSIVNFKLPKLNEPTKPMKSIICIAGIFPS